jgi:hypothetical protein
MQYIVTLTHKSGDSEEVLIEGINKQDAANIVRHTHLYDKIEEIKEWKDAEIQHGNTGKGTAETGT